MKYCLVLFAVVLAVSVSGMCQTPPGVGAASFARIGIDARPLGMGGAFVAVAEGTPIPYYNPAGLVNISSPTIDGMYSEPFGHEFGISFQNLSVQGKLGSELQTASSKIGVALTWIGMQIKDILIWDEDDPTSVESCTATSNLYIASVALPVFENWAIGVSAKLYRERILEGRGEGFGIDIGAIGTFMINDTPFTVGINAMDITETTITWRQTAGEPDNYVSWVNKIGLSANLFEEKVLIAFDYDWAVGRPSREQTLHLGIEGRPVNLIALRAGWTGNLESGGAFSGGVGITLLGRFSLDYAYVPGKALGATHFVSMQFAF